ncbi:MAG: Ig-like domain-containing protein [Gemmatimonadaceae bacterium]
MTPRLALLLRLSIATAVAFTLACGGKDGPTAPQIGSVTLSKDTATLVPNATAPLGVAVKDVAGNSLSGAVAWTTSDPSHVTVSGSGVVTGVAVGTATITATAGTHSASALVTVKEGAVIGAAGGVVTALGGTVTLIVPQGALTSSAQITVQAAANPTPTPRLVTGTAIELGPSGQQFVTPVMLSIRYTAAQLPTSASELLLRINHDAGGIWQPVPGSTTDVVTKAVNVSLTSLGIFSVLASPITGITMFRDQATLEEGATLQLAASPHDTNNVIVSETVLEWRSSNTNVATVTANGLVTAVARGGPVDITATANGRTGTTGITVTIASGPRIALLPTVASFIGATGGASPGANTIDVTNGGSGTLSGLAATLSYASGEPTGWLTTSLSQATAPATLTITPNSAGLTSGMHQATVTVSSSVADVPPRTLVVTLTLLAPAILVNGGDNQAAMAATQVPVPPTVIVRDGFGMPMVGLSVTFTVTGGDGVLTSPVTTTDVNGGASAGSWILGSVANPNAVTATVSGPGFVPGNNSITFSATGCEGGGGASSYAITLCFVTAMTASQRSAFEDAAARWSSLVTGDLPDVPVLIPRAACGPNSPSLNMLIDDLVIYARIEPIDGLHGILGAAGPCFIRSNNGLSLLGQMRFDIADMPALEANDQLRSVILHEMGHVLGFGSLWQEHGLLVNPSKVGGPPLDTYFSGANAIAAFNTIGGSTYTGSKVPVENMFGSGTIDGHWRESILGNELMTGFINGGVSNPLSALTVRSLADLGYTVDATGADPFQLALSLQSMAAPLSEQRAYGNDVIVVPLRRVDSRGRVVSIH